MELTPKTVDELLVRRRARTARFGDLEYVRLTDDYRGAPRGTVVFGDRVVHGYPSIQRILRLETGLREQFRGPFRAEEKIDGYNVRVFRTSAGPLAVSRGGFVCPFTTDRLPDLLDLRVLDEHPDAVLCAEVAGPGNPYGVGGPPDAGEDVRLYVFDVMYAGGPGFAPREELERLGSHHALPVVRSFGRFRPEDHAALRGVVRSLDAERREGIVLKEDPPGTRRVKYTAAQVMIDDFRATGRELLDLPAQYFTGRLLRLALFADEEGLPRERLHAGVGEALLEGVMDALRQCRDDNRVSQRFRCRFRQRENAERFLDALTARAKPVQIVPGGIVREDNYYVLTFERVYPAMTGLLAQLLRGGTMRD